MIYCSKCGTANRRGSRFCNECGELLPAHTALRCPMCGAMNPVGNVYCDRCNARIVPMGTAAPEGQEQPSSKEQTPIKGLSLPTISQEEPQEPLPGAVTEGAGDWLTQLRGLTAQEEPPSSAAVEGSGDWLAQLRGSTGEEVPTGAEKAETGDWLSQLRASAEDVGEAESAPPETVEPVEIPDWLRGVGPVAAEAEVSPPKRPTERAMWEETTAPVQPEPAGAEMPDWLREIAPPSPTVTAPVPAEMPDWLREIAPSKATAPIPTTPAPAPAEMADWLHEIAPAETTTPMPTAPAPAQAEMPDWLREITIPGAAAPAAEAALEKTEPVAFTPAQAATPDWLQELGLPKAAAPKPEEPSPTPLTPALTQVANWLSETAPSEATAHAVEETVPEMPPPAPAEIPDWLRSMGPPGTAAPQAAPATSPFMEAPPSAASETPAWLAKLKPGAAPAAPAAPPLEGMALPAAEAEETGGLARAEIPDWLQAMRPREEVPAAAAEEAPETAGLLEGLRGVLVPAGEAAYAREQAPSAEIGEASLARAQMLQSLLTQPIEVARPKVRKRKVSTAEQVLQTLAKLLLALAVAGVLFAQYLQENQEEYGVSIEIPPLAQPVMSTRVEGLHTAVQNVGAGTTVLIVFEYGPVEADELNIVAQPIVEHLVAQQARIIVASTQPEGSAMAAGLMSIAAEDVHYCPGGATGVAQLLADVRAQTGASPDLILVLAARPAPLRWWVEQTRALSREGSPPLVAGVSAALEPVASPYLAAGQLRGMVGGLSGAAAYEKLRGVSGQATSRFNALAAGHATIVVLMLAGAIIYALAGPRRRQR